MALAEPNHDRIPSTSLQQHCRPSPRPVRVPILRPRPALRRPSRLEAVSAPPGTTHFLGAGRTRPVVVPGLGGRGWALVALSNAGDVRSRARTLDAGRRGGVWNPRTPERPPSGVDRYQSAEVQEWRQAPAVGRARRVLVIFGVRCFADCIPGCSDPRAAWVLGRRTVLRSTPWRCGKCRLRFSIGSSSGTPIPSVPGAGGSQHLWSSSHSGTDVPGLLCPSRHG